MEIAKQPVLSKSSLIWLACLVVEPRSHLIKSNSKCRIVQQHVKFSAIVISFKAKYGIFASNIYDSILMQCVEVNMASIFIFFSVPSIIPWVKNSIAFAISTTHPKFYDVLCSDSLKLMRSMCCDTLLWMPLWLFTLQISHDYFDCFKIMKIFVN